MGCKVRASNRRVGEDFRTRLARLLDPPSLLYKELCVIARGGVMWPNLGLDHLLPSSAEDKERVFCKSVPLWALVACSR